MTTVKIGGDERLLSDADPQWVEREINGRRHDGLPVTVVVIVQANDAELCLMAPPRGGGGGSRHFTTRELAVIEAWEQNGLNGADFSAGSLIAFLRRLAHLL